MANANKSKGKSGERELCKIFGKKFDETFIRVPNSGAFIGGLNNVRAKSLSVNQKEIMANDIIPPECFPNCALECKFYKEFSFNMLMDPKGYALLNEWIDQVYESGIDMEKAFPMICFKINNKGWHIVVWSDKIKSLDITGLNHNVYNHKGHEYKIFEMETFLDKFNKELRGFFSDK